MPRVDRSPRRSTRTQTTRSSRGALVAFSLSLLVGHSVIVLAVRYEPAAVVANLALLAVTLWWAVHHHLDVDELGLTWRRATGSAGAGALVVAPIVVAVGLLALAGALPSDAAVAAASTPSMLFRALIAIPLGTAVAEELMFRGVLLAAWDRVAGPRASTAITSVLFGLWHIAAESLRLGGLAPAAALGVAATGAAGALVLTPLRRRTGSVAAPIVVHAGVNVSVLVAVWLAAGGG